VDHVVGINTTAKTAYGQVRMDDEMVRDYWGLAQGRKGGGGEGGEQTQNNRRRPH